MLLSIDPGLRAVGAALWTPDGVLHRAALVRGSRDGVDSVAWTAIAHALRDFSGGGVSRLVSEFPRVYPHGGKGDPNDLLQLAAVVGGLARTWPAAAVTIVRPSAWKGSVPKHVTVARARKDLSPEEIARIDLPPPSLAHNVWDAVGIGLWALRAERRALSARTAA